MRKLIAACSAALIAMAMLGACGGDSDKPSSGPDGDSSSTTTTDGSDGNNDDNGDNDFAAKFAAARNERFKITYTSDGGDPQTYAQDGKGNSVYGDSNSQFFTSSSGSVTCNTDSEGKATCTALPVGASVSPFLGLFNAGQTYVQALGRFADTESKTLAGRDAECVTFSKETVKDAGAAGRVIASAIKGSLTYCVDKDTGVLLESSTKDQSGTTTNSFTVTKFEEPSDSDFTPPATPSSYTIPGQ